jgi:hypothetical protein
MSREQFLTDRLAERSAELDRFRALLGRWLRLAESKRYRDHAHLNLDAHPLADETRGVLAS